MKSNRRSLLLRTGAGLAASVLALTACGSDDSADPPADDPSSAATSDPEVNTVPPESPGDTDTTDASASDPGASEAQGLQQTGPVTVTGDPLPEFGSPADDPAVGMASPVIEGQSFDGTSRTIGEPTANPTMVVFLAHWCPHCNEEVPVLVGLADDGSIPEGLDVLGVSTAAAPDRENYPPSEWLDDREWPFDSMADDEDLTAISAMGGASFPFTVILDADGTVLARRAGEASADEALEFIDDALANATASA